MKRAGPICRCYAILIKNVRGEAKGWANSAGEIVSHRCVDRTCRSYAIYFFLKSPSQRVRGKGAEVCVCVSCAMLEWNSLNLCCCNTVAPKHRTRRTVETSSLFREFFKQISKLLADIPSDEL